MRPLSPADDGHGGVAAFIAHAHGGRRRTAALRKGEPMATKYKYDKDTDYAALMEQAAPAR